MNTPPGDATHPSPSTPDLNAAEQGAAISKITWRLLPLLFFSYIIAYIDRINVGFAKLQLREVLGVDPGGFSSVYGLGAGLFFIGYFLFEVPSNLILHRVGARVWLARIMVVWGFVSIAFMFLKGVTMFYTMRFLLGVAEAGFFPGVILYLTYWYPAKERARTVALFTLGGIAAGVLGSPISGVILGMDGIAKLAGWQWLFLLEGIPAVLMGLVLLLFLPNGPQQAHWLSDREKAWLQHHLALEAATVGATQRRRLRDVFLSRHVWLLCLLYFLLNVGGYGYEMWLPTIVKGFSGQSDRMVGFINIIPYFVAGVVMILVGRYSDRSGERRLCVAASATSAALGFALAAYFQNPYLAIAALTLAFAGIKAMLGPFWALSTAFLSGTAAAGGIAFINSVGNLGGFAGPTLVGLVKDRTGSDVAGLLLLGGALLAMGLLACALPNPASRSNPATSAAAAR